MVSRSAQSHDRDTVNGNVPPLENGDRLTRPEFERRYAAMPDLKKAELIEGVVYMAAALRFKNHGQPHAQLTGWLFNYYAATPGTDLGDAPTVRLDWDNEPQPDVALLIVSEAGGQTWISEDDYIEGAPELIAEVASSSVAYDLGAKKQAYRRNGVQEYLVWQTAENRLDWFVLEAGEYRPLTPNAAGIICSRIFPGLWLAVDALLAGDMPTVLSVLQQGLNSPEHQEFAQSLQAKRSSYIDS